MKTMLTVLPLFIILSYLFLYLPSSADMSNQYVENGFVVNIAPEYRDIICPVFNNGELETGVAEIDWLIGKYGIYRFEREFPASERYSNTSVDLSGYYIVEFSPLHRLEDVINDFSSCQCIEHVERIGVCPVFAIYPDDPLFSEQWYLDSESYVDIDAPEGWIYEHGDASPIIAIIDTGVDYRHPDLINSIWINDGEVPDNGVDDDKNGYVDDIIGWDFVHGVRGDRYEDCFIEDNDPMDWYGHGTLVAGVASATTDNGVGVSGVGWGARIMVLRAGWGWGPYGFVRMDFCARAIFYAVNMGACVVNCSWSSSNSGGISAAVSYAVSKGVVVVVAVGNTGDEYSHYLASRGDTFCVAGSDMNGRRAIFSSYGSNVDVSAPAFSIMSTYRYHHGEHTYVSRSGTSMSAPQVSGLCALIKAQNPSLGGKAIMWVVHNSTKPMIGDEEWEKGLMGSGIISVENALCNEMLSSECANIEIPTEVGVVKILSVSPSPSDDYIDVLFSSPCGVLSADIFDISGRKVLKRVFNVSGGEGEFSILLDNFNSGVYVLRLSDGIASDTMRFICIK